MSKNPSLQELLDAIAEAAEKANPEEAKSALSYCLKQLKISVAANRED